jgi:integrase
VKTTNTPGIYSRGGKYVIKFRDEDGKQRYETFPTMALAKRGKRDKLNKLDRGIRVAPTERTFGDVWKEWQAVGLPRLRPRTQTTYARSTKNYLLPTFEHKKIQRIDERMIAQWIVEMEARGLKAWTIRAAMSPMRKVFQYAVRLRLIPESPISRLEKDERPRGDQATKRVASREQLGDLFYFASPRFELAIRMAAFTGLRAGELLGLVWEDLDLSEGFLSVTRQLDDGARVEPKTPGAKRKVFLMPALVKALKAHRLASAYSQDHEPVFAMDDGRHMTYPSLEQGMKTAATKAGLRDKDKGNVTLNSLRHGYGSMLIAQGENVVYVSRQMGHASPTITLAIYAHEFANAEQAEKATARMEKAFGAMV